MTQAELAEQAELSRQTVSNIERGTVDATIGNLFAICRVLRLSPSNVFWEVGDPGVVEHIESDLLYLVAERANRVIADQWRRDRERGIPLYSLNGEPVKMPCLSLSMVDGVLKALGQLGLYTFPQMVLSVDYYQEMPCGHLRQDIVSADEGTAYCGRCAEGAAAKEQPQHGIDWGIKAGQNTDNVDLFFGEKTPTGRFVIPLVTLERVSMRDKEFFESVRYFAPLHAAAKGEPS